MNSQKQKKHTGIKKTVSVALMGAICLSAALSVTAFTKTVTVTDGNKTVAIDTMNPDTSDVLMETDFKLGENDKLIRTDDSISILRAFNVNTDNEMTIIENNTVALADDENESSDVAIKIENWVSVKVNLRGKQMNKDVPAGTVEEALAYLNTEINKYDTISVDKDEQVTDGMEIVVTRTTYKTVTKTEDIDFETIHKDTSTLYVGESQVDTEGVKGEKETVIKEKYINGKKVSEEVVTSKVKTEPVNEVILDGTAEKEVFISSSNNDAGYTTVDESTNTITDMYGNVHSYSYALSGPTTAYTADYGALTSTGRLARHGVVAVDPSEIPYGSILYIVTDDGFEYGYAVAGDTGGFIYYTDVVVDLYFDTLSECCNYGLRNATIYVLTDASEDMTY